MYYCITISITGTTGTKEYSTFRIISYPKKCPKNIKPIFSSQVYPFSKRNLQIRSHRRTFKTVRSSENTVRHTKT